MDLNKAQIIGNLTRDPEVRSTTSGQSVASFGVATNRVWKDKASGERKSSAEFHNIVAWGRLAEICQQYIKKGSKVYIEGRLQTRSWEDPSGVKKYRTEIVAQNLIMLDKKGEGPSGTGANQAPSKKSQPEEEEINVDDIPF